MDNYFIIIDKRKHFKINNDKYLSKKNNKYFRIYLILFFVFINILVLYELKKRKYNQNIYKNEYREEMANNYSLYNLIKYPQISLLIINIDKWDINDKELLYLINNLRNQSLLDIEIIFCLSESIDKNQIEILNNFKKIEKRIQIIELNNNNIIHIFNKLMNKLKGKFILVIDKLLNFEQDELEKYYNLTKGKINNIFKFSTNNKTINYLIKSKIIKDILDKGIELNNYEDLINYILKLKEPKINIVSVALCPNNYYTGLAYVCMISILSSKDIFTFISFNIIIPNNFSQKNIDFLLSLYDQYDFFNITFLKIDNRYERAFISRYITCQSYYRFSLGELLPNLSRIIYLDTDTIILSDLNY